MTTVQLSSTFNTVHKNTSHINEQSVYTQGRPRTCDHTECLYYSLSLTLFLSFSLSLSFPVPGRGRETRTLCTKKIFGSSRRSGQKRKERATRKYDFSPGVETVYDDAPLELAYRRFSSIATNIVQTRRFIEENLSKMWCEISPVRNFLFEIFCFICFAVCKVRKVFVTLINRRINI